MKMPDIAMCKNENCPYRNTCYRYRAIPDLMQAYLEFQFTNPKARSGREGCNYFIQIKKNQEVRDM
jgi:hypothetical protein